MFITIIFLKKVLAKIHLTKFLEKLFDHEPHLRVRSDQMTLVAMDLEQCHLSVLIRKKQ